MKRKRFLLAILVLLMMVWAMPAAAATEVTLDGEKIALTKEPVLENNRILVPLRAVSEALGAEVKYDNDTRTVRASRHGTFLRLTLDSDQAYINDKPILLDAPAKVISGTTMVPLRFVGEALGLDVKYEEDKIDLITKDYVKVHFIDVGNGDAILIQLPNNQNVLIDAGSQVAGKDVLSALRENGVTEIDLLVATHPHENNMGGIPSVLETFTVKQIIDSGAGAGTETYMKYSSLLRKGNYKYSVAEKQKVNLNGATLEILSSRDETWSRDVDGKSVVSLLTVGEVRFLFMADVCYPYDRELKINGPVEILKAAFQGGKTSTSQDFLNKVTPETVIISVGKNNTGGFPHEDTLERISEMEAQVFRTDLNGDIVISTNGKTYGVQISKNELPETKRRIEPPAEQGVYVGHKDGDIFHWPHCSRAKKIDFYDRVWFKDATHAKDNGYKPCEFCRPE
ncbi:stalk domain-containing protein [Desulforamulus aquiferis]|uniref:Stalk domain-containing protein n=1 Tax=Desulforamulus aquiferis TaxID=1397668 RepID=A0AAW7ZAY1_9FIRM|nr:stalk domain-containing protein [Desulforamulus aquiferis]MDO7786842.1 stalk domain-containing protein [Desulforamulus aquiferis]